jgi:hypothetical protein
MIRKRNKYANDVEKTQAEQKTREENLRKAQELRAQLKLKQMDLTNNLKKTYSHIRPTIIQGQRILKIIENLEFKMGLLVPYSSKTLQSLGDDKLEESLAKIKTSLMFLRTCEEKFFEIKEELRVQENLYRAYAEDDEDLNENESHVIVNQEQEQIFQLIKKREEELSSLCEKFKKEIRNLLRALSDDPKIAEYLRSRFTADEKEDGDNILKICFDTIVSLKYLFLKKLSTGYDEQETHQRMMEKLRTNIDENERLFEEKESDLQNIKQDRASSNTAKNEEITNCKNDLISIKKQESDKLEQMREEDRKKRQKTFDQHSERENKLKSEIARSIKELEDLEKRNLEEETQFNKINDDLEKRIENLTSEYDTSVGALKVLFKEEQVF